MEVAAVIGKPPPVVVLILAAAALAAQEKKRNASPEDKTRWALEGIKAYAPYAAPSRVLNALGDSAATRDRALLDEMLKTRVWFRFCALFEQLVACARDRAAAELLGRLKSVEDGKVRQNVIFLAALVSGEPGKLLAPVFRRETAWSDKNDAIDAGVALAMLGGKEAVRWLLNEYEGDTCFKAGFSLEFDRLAEFESRKNARSVMRSYRAFEILARRAYFLLQSVTSRPNQLFPSLWCPAPIKPADDEHAEEMLGALIALWPHHPGADNFAYHACCIAARRGDALRACRWALLGSLLGDGDRAHSAFNRALSLVEAHLNSLDLHALLRCPEAKLYPRLLRYELFLHLARRSLPTALTYFDRLAEEDEFFAAVKRLSADVSAPGGLKSGVLEELSRRAVAEYDKTSRRLRRFDAYPLEEIHPGEAPETLPVRCGGRVIDVPVKRPWWAATDAESPHPPPSDYSNIYTTGRDRSRWRKLHPERIARQYRLLLALRELRRMEESETDPVRKADLRYKRAALLYHNRRIFHPAWAGETHSFAHALNNPAPLPKERKRRYLRCWAEHAFAHLRAYRLFDSILRDCPSYPGRDKVLFSMAICYSRILLNRTAQSIDAWPFPENPPEDLDENGECVSPERDFGHRRVMELMYRVADEHPESTLADDAARAARYRQRLLLKSSGRSSF